MSGGPLDSNLTTNGKSDFVVALTQSGLNKKVKHMLTDSTSSATSTKKFCYVSQLNSTDPVQKDYDTFLHEAGVTADLFSPTYQPGTADRTALTSHNFLFAIKLKPGYPDRIPASSKANDVVTLGSSTLFTMYFSEVTVVYFKQSSNPSEWHRMSQEVNYPWKFQSAISFGVEKSVPATSVPDIITRSHPAGSTFDRYRWQLGDALPLWETTQFDEVPKFLKALPRAYWTALMSTDSTVLGFVANPSGDKAYTVTYHFTGDAQYTTAELAIFHGEAVNPVVAYPLTWKWAGASNPHDGVVALRRQSFMSMLDEVLLPIAQAACHQPKLSWDNVHNVPVYEWSPFDPNKFSTLGLQDIPNVILPSYETGPGVPVLSYRYNDDRRQDSNGNWTRLDYAYWMTVRMDPKNPTFLRIDQAIDVQVEGTFNGSHFNSFSVIQGKPEMFTDEYVIGVSRSGYPAFTLKSSNSHSVPISRTGVPDWAWFATPGGTKGLGMALGPVANITTPDLTRLKLPGILRSDDPGITTGGVGGTPPPTPRKFTLNFPVQDYIYPSFPSPFDFVNAQVSKSFDLVCAIDLK